ncbi:tRNA pseudouridine(38-40) synthase TruA [Corallococcus sp. H22C18031201]|uniref:tRNA pseudouridine(38-40) synthase TruA n=1 Tax=Citreicoccus inhibens TaxID=2849499 RepID=UPI000E754FF6|nr:tRNA pseudouridine(38-40) synthase TruA [Citreicoccus inhibens]MBU8899776.1 tRNA pseudouridine(38-40) synthase TruA [Citreicoccus inhibens]RJS19165.1 tRNA pseudouridine(38-40) synthase TruA [Corallococcus sp. H22C18031201]
MPRLKLTLEYDGTRYVGWQMQPNGPSIQAVMQDTLARLLGEPVVVNSAGRTDSGVHAEGQVACFDTARVLPLKAYRMGLNGMLPSDIAVVAAEEVPAEFDPRRWSRGKRYRYRVSNRPTRSPLRRDTHWEVFAPLDVEAMRRAARVLEGRHDFSAFRASDCQAKHAMREIRSLRVEGTRGDAVSFVVEGTAFLKHMVRNLVGTLVDVGKGKRPEAWVAEVLASLDRKRAGPTAPPQGLVLEEVFYGDGPPGGDEDED